jgi:ribosomal-protein-alanine N-acetyltransferase
MRPEVALRPVTPGDAAVLARLYAAQREFLAPFEPIRSEAFFTEDGQRAQLERTVALRADGLAERFLILVGAEPAGVVAVSNVVRGAFMSANVGYFVAREHNGRGVATRAVGRAASWAFAEAGLHRLEAGTLVDNVASQRVLEKNGFVRIGRAPRYLRIAGEWRDHILYQRTCD